MINFAVIDLGSNSVRMTITQIKKDASIEVTHQLKEWYAFQKTWDLKKSYKQNRLSAHSTL